MIKIKILGVFANQSGRGVKIKLIGGSKESMTAYVDDIIMVGKESVTANIDYKTKIEDKMITKKFNLISFIRNLLE